MGDMAWEHLDLLDTGELKACPEIMDEADWLALKAAKVEMWIVGSRTIEGGWHEKSDYDFLVLSRGPIPDVPDDLGYDCLLYTSPSPRDGLLSRMPSSA